MKNGKWGLDDMISSLNTRAENDYRSSTLTYLTNLTSGLDHYCLPVRRVDYDKEILGGCVATQYIPHRELTESKKNNPTLGRSASQLEVAPIRYGTLYVTFLTMESDVPHRIVYFSESLKDTVISGTVAYLLSNIPSSILLEAEDEV